MESALLGPAVYQLQSEISARPSSPLVRFPSGSLDPAFAARHMNLLHADTLLLRSAAGQVGDRSERAVRQDWPKQRPFALYRLRGFDSHLIELVRQPIRVRPAERLDAGCVRLVSHAQPVRRVSAGLRRFGARAAACAPCGGVVRAVSLSRHELVFETNAIGSPHLIKIAYHPRWQLQSKGQLCAGRPRLHAGGAAGEGNPPGLRPHPGRQARHCGYGVSRRCSPCSSSGAGGG